MSSYIIVSTSYIVIALLILIILSILSRRECFSRKFLSGDRVWDKMDADCNFAIFLLIAIGWPLVIPIVLVTSLAYLLVYILLVL